MAVAVDGIRITPVLLQALLIAKLATRMNWRLTSI
jgi:hypothetical protein